MSTSIIKHPYRSGAIVPVKPAPKYFGLLLAPKPEKEHKCYPPGYFHRLYQYIIGKRIYIGSLYKCQCTKYYEFNYDSDWVNIGPISGAEDWKRLGGELPNE
jgi:hypothetical protein